VAVAAAVLAVYGSWVRQRVRTEYHGNYSGFIQLGRDRFDDNPLVMDRPDIRRTLVLVDGNGYDGQFMYYMAFDPFLRRFDSYRRVVDYPPYRFGRIGYPLLIKLVSADRWRLFPIAMVALILGGIAVAAAGIGGLSRDIAPFAGVIVAFIPGFWESIRIDLPEPLAAGLVIAAFWMLSRRSIRLAGVCFALAVLVRETSVIFALAAAVAELAGRRRKDALTVAALTLVPLLAWRLYVGWTQFPMYGSEAFFVRTNDFGVPFAGFWDMWNAIRAHQYFAQSAAVTRAALSYVVLIGGAIVLCAVLLIETPTAAAGAGLVYGLVAVSLNYEPIWGAIGGAIRDTFEPFVALALATTAWRRYGRATRLGLVAFWVASAVFVLFLSENAESVRGALVFWR
jgi:hypothetical protein